MVINEKKQTRNRKFSKECKHQQKMILCKDQFSLKILIIENSRKINSKSMQIKNQIKISLISFKN